MPTLLGEIRIKGIAELINMQCGAHYQVQQDIARLLKACGI
jgi:hypothetical protein